LVMSASLVLILDEFPNLVLPLAAMACVMLLAMLLPASRLMIGAADSRPLILFIHVVTGICGLVIITASIMVADEIIDDEALGLVLISMNATTGILVAFAFAATPTV